MTRAPRFTQSRVYLILIKMLKKGAKVLPPGLWELIFEDPSPAVAELLGPGTLLQVGVF